MEVGSESAELPVDVIIKLSESYCKLVDELKQRLQGDNRICFNENHDALNSSDSCQTAARDVIVITNKWTKDLENATHVAIIGRTKAKSQKSFHENVTRFEDNPGAEKLRSWIEDCICPQETTSEDNAQREWSIHEDSTSEDNSHLTESENATAAKPSYISETKSLPDPSSRRVFQTKAAAIAIIIISIVCYDFYHRSKPVHICEPTMERYMQELEQLKNLQKNQDERFWRVANAAMKPHIFDKNPRQPAVVMIGSSKEASAARENLAEQIAKIYSMKCNDTRPVQVQGENLSSLNPGDAKKKIDTDIHAAFSGGACAAIVSNFEKLPPSATTVFYQFCENDAAPYKDVIILFTTEIRTWEWLGDNQAELLADGGPKPKFWSRAVEDYIQHSLMTRDNTGKMTVDMIGGLLTRITPLVAWVRDQG